jgi:hypothetical protein
MPRSSLFVTLVGRILPLVLLTASPAVATEEPWYRSLPRRIEAKASPIPSRPPERVASAPVRIQELARTPEEMALREAFPSGLVSWREGRPHRILLPGTVVSAEKDVAAFRREGLRLVARWPELFPCPPESLRLERAHHAAGIWFLSWRQTHAGWPVEGARLEQRWTDAGQLVLVGSDLRRIRLETREPRLGRPEALERAASALGLPGLRVDSASIVVVPRGYLGQPQDRLAWRLVLRPADRLRPGRWLVWVDAVDGRILGTRDLLFFGLQARGRIEAEAETLTADGATARFPAAYAWIQLQTPEGQPVGEETYADAQGLFDLGEWEETALDYVTFLQGRFCRIRRGSPLGLTPVQVRPVSGTGEDAILWDGLTALDSERDAYVHVNIAHDVTKAWDPEWTGLDYPLTTVVDSDEGTCNAYWDGEKIVFFHAGDGCVSTARIADVVYHEYAHGVTETIFLPDFASPELHEAYSDYFGTTLTDQPLVGLGFFGPGTHLRDVDEDRVWPDDISGDPHMTGLILAGAFWDLRKAVGPEVADRLYHFHRYGRPETFDDVLTEVLVVDDDDGNVYNGTPHFPAIVEAFLAHGIGDPSVHIQHDPLPDTEAAETPMTVEASVLSLLGLDPDSLLLYYRTDPASPYETVPLAPGEGIRQFRAEIPGQPSGTVVDYFLFAADTSGHRAWLPAGAPDTVFSFFVGPDTIPPVVQVRPLPDATADQDSFLVEAEATDNTARLASVVLVAQRPSDGMVVERAMERVSGSLFRTYWSPGPLSLGDLLSYRVEARDASAAGNAAAWPGIDQWATFRIREGQFTDLEATDGGFLPTGDWEWGIPDAGWTTARSGQRVWATRLAGRYSDNTVSDLTGPVWDLAGWDRAALEFWHRYDTEAGYDGGQIQASTDGGQTWRILVPRGGYPQTQLPVFDGPGYTGSSGGWVWVEVALDAYLGRSVQVRWRLASDPYVNDEGWALDDIRLIRRQVLVEPGELVAGSGIPEGIPLSWGSPPGVDTRSERFLGYNLYRRRPGQAYPSEPINAEPIRGTSHLDTDVVPGETYFYRVTALYDEGESAPSDEVRAVSFRAVLALEADSLAVEVAEGAVRDTSLVVRNDGEGTLTVWTYLTDADRSLDEVRPVLPVAGAPPGSLVVLARDGQDALGTPDLREAALGVFGDAVRFLFREYGPHGDPREDFTVAVGLDTDLDLTTGMAGTNLGVDRYLLLGRLAYGITQGASLGVVVNSQGTRIEGMPSLLRLEAGEDSILVEVPLSILGNPRALTFQMVSLGGANELLDILPDTLEASWLERAPRRGEVTPQAPLRVMLSVDASDLCPERYGAALVLESNDPDHPRVRVPIDLVVGDPENLALRELAVRQELEGLLLEWEAPDCYPFEGFRVVRRDASGECPEVVLNGGALIPPDAEGRYRYLDRGARAGRTYVYAFTGVLPGGEEKAFVPWTEEFAPLPPPELSLLRPWPQPARRLAVVRLGLPHYGNVTVLVYDLRGRRIRTLFQGSLPGGVHDFTWDGRTDSGQRVASGLYFVRLLWGTTERTQRLLWVR